MRLTIEIPKITEDKLRDLCAEWNHPHSDGMETHSEASLILAISREWNDLQERKLTRIMVQ